MSIHIYIILYRTYQRNAGSFFELPACRSLFKSYIWSKQWRKERVA